MAFGNAIASERTRLGLTQEQLAKRLGCGQSAVSGWENETRDPGTDMWILLADMFGCSIDYLMGQTEERTRK